MDDVADFIDAADTNKDGMIDYAEYMDMLEPDGPPDDAEDSKATSSATARASSPRDSEARSPRKKTPRATVAKVEPFGAEEIRAVMIHRKQLEQAREREDRVRRQAYKDALDVKVFEEELDASRWRKGGANPNVYQMSGPAVEGSGVPVVVTDFNFFANQQPLRFSSTGKFTFFPFHYGCSFAPKIRPLSCTKGHSLSVSRSRNSCALCRTQGTDLYCARSGCSFRACTRCMQDHKAKQENDAVDPAKYPTFLRCSNACSFTLQVPVAGGAQPETGRFSVTLELRVDKLPPTGQLQSLLRFPLPAATQAIDVEKVHRTSVYLNSSGIVVGRPVGTGGLAESARASAKVLPDRWVILTVCVDPSAGRLRVFVDGEFSHESSGLDPADLRLHHKIVVLGGGKQAHARGGDMRRVVLHSAELSSEAVKAEYWRLAADSPSIGGRLVRFQAIVRGRLMRKAGVLDYAAKVRSHDCG